jgi:hypothetical protein
MKKELTTDFNTLRLMRAQDEHKQEDVNRQLHLRPRLRAGGNNKEL